MGPVEDTTRSCIHTEPQVEIRIGVANSHTSKGTRESGGQEIDQWPNGQTKTSPTEGYIVRSLFPLYYECITLQNSE